LAEEEDGTELVCAKIEFGAGMLNPLIASLPEPLVVSDSLPALAPTLQLHCRNRMFFDGCGVRHFWTPFLYVDDHPNSLSFSSLSVVCVLG
jgi:hypothetical protein